MANNGVPKSDQTPSDSESSSESMGDSEANLELRTDTNDSNYDDDAESTSGDLNSNSSRSIDEDNFQQDHMMRSKMLSSCKEYWWHDEIHDDVKHMMVFDHDREVVIEEKMAEEEVALQVDNAETNRLFWDNCIAHGY